MIIIHMLFLCFCSGEPIDEAEIEKTACIMGYGAVKYADLKNSRLTSYKCVATLAFGRCSACCPFRCLLVGLPAVHEPCSAFQRKDNRNTAAGLLCPKIIIHRACTDQHCDWNESDWTGTLFPPQVLFRQHAR